MASYESGFITRQSQENSKIQDLLQLRSLTATVHANATTRIVLPVWTTENIIDMALNSLQLAAHQHDTKAIAYKPDNTPHANR